MKCCKAINSTSWKNSASKRYIAAFSSSLITSIGNKRIYAMDQNKLRTLVFEKTGIKIDTTDPVFAVVALNEAVLSEYLERHLAVMNDVAERVNAQTRQL